MNSNLILFLTLHCLATSSFLRVATAIPIETSEDLEKRSMIDRISEDYPDYQLGVRYDEYPTIVPKKRQKRTAMLVNRLMVALRDALEDEERDKNGKPLGVYGNSIPEDVRSMDLQRRGHQSLSNGQNKARIYWRCYFNAVSCF